MLLNLNDVTPNNAKDLLASVPDALALAMGAHFVSDPHPFAELVAPSPLRAAAFAAGQLMAARRPGEPETAVIGRGLRTLDFGNAVATGLQAVARRRFDAQAQHIKAISVVEVTRIGEPEPVGALDLADSFENVDNGTEYYVSRGALHDGETIKLSSFGRILGLSRETIFNDELALIEDAISASGVTAARHEARLVGEALEANPTLADGNAVFGAAFGNVSGVAFDAAGLSSAMSALRTQPAADGLALDAVAAVLFVASDIEYTARHLVNQAGLPIAVHVLPGLAAGRYYLSASRDVIRSIAAARLEGQSHPLAVEAVRTPVGFDGAFLRVRIDTGAAMVGRVGIVRGGI